MRRGLHLTFCRRSFPCLGGEHLQQLITRQQPDSGVADILLPQDRVTCTATPCSVNLMKPPLLNYTILALQPFDRLELDR